MSSHCSYKYLIHSNPVFQGSPLTPKDNVIIVEGHDEEVQKQGKGGKLLSMKNIRANQQVTYEYKTENHIGDHVKFKY